MPKSWNQTFVALIPEKEKPRLVSDLHSISLCNVCYKLVTKILPNRLKKFLPSLINREHCGFVYERNSLDNIIVVQEVVHSMYSDVRRPPRMSIKVVFEKSYDTLQ